MKMIVISLGGSLVVPGEIDVDYLKKFKALIEKYSSQEFRFVIIVGGGSVCRKYQKAMTEIIGDNREGADWLGISVTHLNAQLVKSMFTDVYPEVIMDPTQKIDFKEKILVAAGWKPGFSSDMDAVLLAKNLGADKMINLTNVAYVYDKDPKFFDDAKKFEDLSWKDFRKIVGDEWNPGLNLPFDPIASLEAEKNKLTVIIAKGLDLPNFKDILDGEKFKGTTIHA
ncbi:UMP kinase [Bacteroidota bacterium]